MPVGRVAEDRRNSPPRAVAAFPGLTTNSATFSNNMTTTFNVFSAARNAGITNIVWASSETVLGLPFDNPPRPGLPAHPQLAEPGLGDTALAQYAAAAMNAAR